MLKIPSGKVVAVDTETTGLSIWKGARPFAVSFCNELEETGYVQWWVDLSSRRVRYGEKDVRTLKEWLADEDVSKVFFNAQFDLRMLEAVTGERVRGRIEDVMLAMHVCSSCEESYKLKFLCKKYSVLQEGGEDEQDLKKAVIDCRRRMKSGESVEMDYWLPAQAAGKNDQCERYAVNDAIRTMRLWHIASDALKGMRRWESYEFEVSILMPVIGKMEERGIRINLGVLRRERTKCMAERDSALRILQSRSGDVSINPRSNPQIIKLLFEREGLKPEGMTKGGNPKTDVESLSMQLSNPAVEALLKYRAAEKGVTQFFNPCERSAVTEGTYDVVYPNIRQAGKKTGRLSVAGPNLQALTDVEGGRSDSNVPARKPFGPRDGNLWFLIDYNQLEVRTFAAASQYEDLINMLRDGRDLHTEATNGIWGGKGNKRAIEAALYALNTGNKRKAETWLESFDYDIVKAEASIGKKTSRNKGKPFFFTRMFGGGARSIAAKLRCSREEAQKLVDDYDRTLPGVIEFVRRAGEEGRRNGFVTTLYGRCLDVPSDESYKSSPYIVQGTAADLVKRAMVKCEHYLEGKVECKCGLILQVHDELIFEFPRDIDARMVLALKRLMESEGSNIEMEVPCKVKIVDRHWSNTSEWRASVVNLNKGNECDVRVGRPTIWGNPFKIGRDGDRQEVIRKYERYVTGNDRLMAKIPDLIGKRLGCHCHPLPCHADVLKKLADWRLYEDS